MTILLDYFHDNYNKAAQAAMRAYFHSDFEPAHFSKKILVSVYKIADNYSYLI